MKIIIFFQDMTLTHKLIDIEDSIEMIYLMLDDDTGKSWKFESFYLFFFVKVSEFYLTMSRKISFFCFWKREASFFYICYCILWKLEYLRVHHSNRRKVFIIPRSHQTYHDDSLRNSNLWSSKSYSRMFRVCDIISHLSSEFCILFPFVVFYSLTDGSKYWIIFSCFYVKHYYFIIKYIF